LFVFGAIVMKRHFQSFMVIALLSTTACSGPHIPVAAISAAPGDLAKVDLDKLQGTWRMESSVWNGVPERDVALRITLIFQGDKLIWVDKDGIQYQEDTIKLMPDQSPKAIDNWNKGRGQARPGIYSLEGDTFKWCCPGEGGKVRPTLFASKLGSRHSLMVLRRQKE
jgi:uncharacterized protein (TIGR03067 family)